MTRAATQNKELICNTSGFLHVQVDFEILFGSHVDDSLGNKDESSEFKEESDNKSCSEDKTTSGKQSKNRKEKDGKKYRCRISSGETRLS